MGGYGSGSYWRNGSRSTTESAKKIDIRWLKKHGHLRPGTTGAPSWNCNGEPVGNISYSMFHDRMILDYKYRVNGGGWQEVKETIRFTETACNYGGMRKWLTCPECNQRVAVLYSNQKLFLCRKCSGVKHGSNLESDLDRLARKARSIRRKLDIGNEAIFDPDNLSDWVCFKPKHMHQKTFDRLRRAENRAQHAMNNEFLARFGYYM